MLSTCVVGCVAYFDFDNFVIEISICCVVVTIIPIWLMCSQWIHLDYNSRGWFPYISLPFNSVNFCLSKSNEWCIKFSKMFQMRILFTSVENKYLRNHSSACKSFLGCVNIHYRIIYWWNWWSNSQFTRNWENKFCIPRYSITLIFVFGTKFTSFGSVWGATMVSKISFLNFL